MPSLLLIFLLARKARIPPPAPAGLATDCMIRSVSEECQDLFAWSARIPAPVGLAIDCMIGSVCQESQDLSARRARIPPPAPIRFVKDCIIGSVCQECEDMSAWIPPLAPVGLAMTSMIGSVSKECQDRFARIPPPAPVGSAKDCICYRGVLGSVTEECQDTPSSTSGIRQNCMIGSRNGVGSSPGSSNIKYVRNVMETIIIIPLLWRRKTKSSNLLMHKVEKFLFVCQNDYFLIFPQITNILTDIGNTMPLPHTNKEK